MSMVNPQKYLELDEMLSYENPVDYWEDDESIRAIKIIKQFEERDWEALKEQIAKKSDIWKERVAQIVTTNPCNNSTEIAVKLVGESHLDTVINALELIQDIDRKKFSVKISSKVAQSAREVIEKSGLIDKAKSEYIEQLQNLSVQNE